MKRIIIGAFVIAILVLLLLAIFWFITPELQVLVTDRIHTADHVLTSSDKLDFAGVMLGSIITIIALCVTIIFTQEQQRETLRSSKLPYIVSDTCRYPPLTRQFLGLFGRLDQTVDKADGLRQLLPSSLE